MIWGLLALWDQDSSYEDMYNFVHLHLFYIYTTHYVINE